MPRLSLLCMILWVQAASFVRVPTAAAAAGRSPVSFGRRTLVAAAFQSYNNNNNSHRRTTILQRKMSTREEEAAAAAKEALLNCPTIPLRNGMEHPAIGFGTYKVGFIPASASSATSGADAAAAPPSDQRSAKDCVADALRVGYRFLECAEFYGNEQQVGAALAESGLERSELFLCSKVWTTTIEQGPDAIRAQLDRTLTELGVDYLDLYLIHWPVPGKHVEAYQTLEAILREKPTKLKGIGVSNYAVEDIQELVDDPNVRELPLVNQIELNPFLYRKETVQQCRDLGIVLQSYRSLRDGKAMTDETLRQIATKHDKTVAQILGRWCVQKGFVYMPKSVRVERMVENGQVFDFDLDDDDVAQLDALTTDDNLQTFLGLYRKCVNRDTTKDGTLEGVKLDITIN